MTPRQVKLLDFIRAAIETTGCAPTYTEMATHMGIGRSDAFAAVEELIRAGKLAKGADGRRRLLLVDSYRSIIDVPTPVLRAELARREVAA